MPPNCRSITLINHWPAGQVLTGQWSAPIRDRVTGRPGARLCQIAAVDAVDVAGRRAVRVRDRVGLPLCRCLTRELPHGLEQVLRRVRSEEEPRMRRAAAVAGPVWSAWWSRGNGRTRPVWSPVKPPGFLVAEGVAENISHECLRAEGVVSTEGEPEGPRDPDHWVKKARGVAGTGVLFGCRGPGGATRTRPHGVRPAATTASTPDHEARSAGG